MKVDTASALNADSTSAFDGRAGVQIGVRCVRRILSSSLRACTAQVHLGTKLEAIRRSWRCESGDGYPWRSEARRPRMARLLSLLAALGGVRRTSYAPRSWRGCDCTRWAMVAPCADGGPGDSLAMQGVCEWGGAIGHSSSRRAWLLSLAASFRGLLAEACRLRARGVGLTAAWPRQLSSPSSAATTTLLMLRGSPVLRNLRPE